MRVVPLNEASEPVRLPDLIWSHLSFSADIAIDPVSGDLSSRSAIETAVLICLMTDCRVETYELPEGERNRGWPGDGFDLQPDERPLGSKLWLLRRRALEPGIETEAEDYAREALHTLIDQKLAVRVDVVATANRAANRLELAVALFGRDGEQMYHNRFAVLWEQTDAA